MRLTIVLLTLLACAVLAGCDVSVPAPTPAAPPPPQACNCTPAPAPAPAPVQTAEVTPRHHHHHRAWHEESSSSESVYSESESDTSSYGYVSDSHGGAAHRYETASYTGGRLWIDGFGRAYHAEHAARAAGTMTRGRLKPWAHYDEDCPDR
jgi:hypothetical protein